MGKKSQALARGLSQIMQDHRMEKDENGQQLQVSKIPLNLIDPNPFQPRRVFNEEEITELAETIKKHGLIQPITVRKYNGRYQIVSGERRTRAAKVAGLTEINAYVHELLSDKNMSEWALIENIQRVDLNPIELAESYQSLLEIHGYTHEDLSETLGKSRSAITNVLRLLKLPEQVKIWVEEGKLSNSAARSLLSPEITDPESVARDIIEKGMNVRDIENITKKVKTEKQKDKTPEIDADMADFQRRLQEFFGTKTSITPSAKNKEEGVITIHYYSMEDLNHLQELMEKS
jgi:ParB family chromosome partitioning protein